MEKMNSRMELQKNQAEIIALLPTNSENISI